MRYTDGGTTIARWNTAVDRRFKRDSDQQQADFVSCIAFGKTAEFVEKYFRQGQKIVVEGRIQTGSYTNKDGQKIYTTDVVAESVEFWESKHDDGGFKPDPSSASGDGWMNIPDGIDDELPFN